MKQENENKNENEKDDIDKYIEDIVNKKISEPEGFEKAIREALYSDKFNKKLRKRQIIRTISTACATVILTSGVAIGGFIVYEKVWKEPKQYTYEELKNTIADTEVSDEEKKDLISEEQAKQTALEIAKNLGYENEVVESIELKQNKREEYEEKYYEIKTSDNIDNIEIKINATDGQIMAFDNMNLLGREENQKQITTEEAVKIADEIYGKINLNEENYELDICREENRVFNGQIRKIWNIKYYKKYDDIINPYELLNFDIIVSINDVKVSSIYTDINGIYEDNPMVVNEQEAITIAINKEKELTDNEISEYTINKGIRKMNKFFYILENSVRKYNKEIENSNSDIIETENTIRNVWIVKIKHHNIINKEVENYYKGKDKEYYIDITTGEIIGGKIIENK